jgi:hypothetical protein
MSRGILVSCVLFFAGFIALSQNVIAGLESMVTSQGVLIQVDVPSFDYYEGEEVGVFTLSVPDVGYGYYNLHSSFMWSNQFPPLCLYSEIEGSFIDFIAPNIEQCYFQNFNASYAAGFFSNPVYLNTWQTFFVDKFYNGQVVAKLSYSVGVGQATVTLHDQFLYLPTGVRVPHKMGQGVITSIFSPSLGFIQSASWH